MSHSISPFLVFGTGRCGTSFVSSVLHNKLGISMGKEFVPPNGTNPDGFWEDIDFYDLNKSFAYHKMPYDEFIDRASELVQLKSKKGVPWGFKESTMSYLLSIYMSIIENPKLIWCKRDKGLTIKSLMRCYGWDEAKAVDLFDIRESFIKNALNGKKHLQINFDEKRKSEDEVANIIVTAMRDPIKVYVAILNRGWIRREVCYRLIPDMFSMDGVTVTWENPNLTWDHPISSNRNKIVKRFLATDNEFLLMIDNDVVPLNNPAKFVFANKDVVGFPAKVRQGDRQLNWVAYVRRPDRHEYAPVDFTKVEHDIELLKVDAVGTGCILIHRRVLEAIKAPFHIHFDEDGILNMGTDFAFCERVSEAGFEIFTTPKRVCEHFKELGMLDMNSYSDCDGVDTAAQKYGIPWGGFAINPVDWEFIKRIILDTKPSRILEFGAGLSSLLMSEYTNVDVWETNEDYISNINERNPNGNLKIHHWDGDDIKIDNKYDLAFIAGPIGKVNGGPGRDKSFKIASSAADRIIIHDAGRDEEQKLEEKYFKGKFRFVKKNGWHQSRCHYWIKDERMDV